MRTTAPPPKPSSATATGRNRRKPRPEPRVPLRVRLEQSVRRLRLDRLGTEQVKRGALRVAMVVSAVALALAVLGVIERHLHTSSSFAIDQIDITGNQQLTSAQVIKSAGLAFGQNVFAVGPEQAKILLLEDPWIESATVRRRLPGRYSIEVRERRAVAMVAAGQLHLVSDEGLLFKPLEPNDPCDLPVITGLDPNLHTPQQGTVGDEQALSSALLSAVALVHDYTDAGLARRETISEIHVENDGSLSLYLGSDATYVRLGKPPFRQKLERLREVMARLAQDKARAAYVYLDNQRRLDRVTARLR